MRVAGFVFLGTLLFAPHSASAQARESAAVIDGVVTDSSLGRLPGVTVSIVGTTTEVTTDERGHFRISGVRAGRVMLMIRRIGYVSLPNVVEVAPGETLRLSLALERIVPALDTVVVAAREPDTPLSEFEQRRRQGVGQFMTRDQIHKLNFIELSTYLLTFRSTEMVDGKLVNRRDRPFKNCSFQFFIDGVLIDAPDVDRQLPRPDELHGIEVYSGPATIPLQYKPVGTGKDSGGNGGGSCGVVLLWTRRGP